jgi:hypothetical protein
VLGCSPLSLRLRNSDKAKIITFTFTQLRRIQSLRPRSLPVAFEYLLRHSRYSTTVAIHFSDPIASIGSHSAKALIFLYFPSLTQHSIHVRLCIALLLMQFTSTPDFFHKQPALVRASYANPLSTTPVERLLQLA